MDTDPRAAATALAHRVLAMPAQDTCCDSCAEGGVCDSERSAPPVVSRQVATPPMGPNDPCLELLRQITEIVRDLMQRIIDALDDKHDLYRYHRRESDAHPDEGIGSWDGHKKFYERRQAELRRLLAEWDDRCGGQPLFPRERERLDEAREYADGARHPFPDKPLHASRESESIWDQLRRHLPEIIVAALIAITAYAVAAALVACFASGACEFALALAGVSMVLALAIAAALRAAGVQDRPAA
jgi:hypothetical protein